MTNADGPVTSHASTSPDWVWTTTVLSEPQRSTSPLIVVMSTVPTSRRVMSLLDPLATTEVTFAAYRSPLPAAQCTAAVSGTSMRWSTLQVKPTLSQGLSMTRVESVTASRGVGGASGDPTQVTVRVTRMSRRSVPTTLTSWSPRLRKSIDPAAYTSVWVTRRW